MQKLSEQKYYYDNDLGKYKLCSYKLSNCEKCIIKNNEFICKECSSEYALKHDENTACADKSSLEGNENFYTNDSGINYSCSLFNDVTHCVKCSNKDTCIECEDPYEMFNINKLCALQSEIDANLYVWNELDILVSCSSSIKDCKKCNDVNTCYECQTEAVLLDNDKCLLKTIIEENKNYYKDEITEKYISCSIIDNCISCESSTKCISCKNGFSVNNNNLCEEIPEDNSKLSTGAIIGIILGCLFFLLLVVIIGYFVIKKIFKKNEGVKIDSGVPVNEPKGENAEIEEIKMHENDEDDMQNKIVVHTKRRSIHNFNI